MWRQKKTCLNRQFRIFQRWNTSLCCCCMLLIIQCRFAATRCIFQLKYKGFIYFSYFHYFHLNFANSLYRQLYSHWSSVCKAESYTLMLLFLFYAIVMLGIQFMTRTSLHSFCFSLSDGIISSWTGAIVVCE